MQDKKKVLIISDAHLIKTFVQPTVLKLKQETGIHFDCFIEAPVNIETRKALAHVFDSVFINEYPKGIMKKMPKIRFFQRIYGLRKLARSLGNYDIAHVHYHPAYYSYFTPIVRKKTKRFFVSFFGSDFNQISNFKHWQNKKTVNLLDGVFATNESWLKKIISRYNISESAKQTGILMPLIDNFASFDHFLKGNTIDSAKQMWQFKKAVIVCGYSAAAIMRHKMMIEALNSIGDKLSDYKVVFPMTYGWRGKEIRTLVNEQLKTSSLDWLVLEDFLTIEKLQALRLATDIFVNIPSRDQMAASMLEHLAAGSVVITGSWLPYNNLTEKGIYFIILESPQELPNVLSDVIENLDIHKNKSRANREIILKMMSWDSIKNNWYKYYELQQNNSP